MIDDYSPQQQQTDPPPIKLMEITENLYIGRITKAAGSVEVAGDNLPALFWGEVLIYGQVDKDVLMIERVRRVALYGSLIDPPAEDRVGLISLAGPLQEPAIEPDPSIFIDDLPLQLHYAALTNEVPPRIAGEHAVFPAVEQIAAEMSIKFESRQDSETVQLEVALDATTLIYSQLEVIQAVHLAPTLLSFILAGTGTTKRVTHNSLTGDCPLPTKACAAATSTRTLPIRFISLSSIYNLNDPVAGQDRRATLEQICQTQLNGVCEVWRNQAALALDVQPEIVQATDAQTIDYCQPDELQERELPTLMVGSPDDFLNWVEVYIIDQFVKLGRHGGSVSYDCGLPSAYCILDLGYIDPNPAPDINPHVLGPNPYLLAHELGHLLGLAHPDCTQGLINSSPGSIMQPGIPNPPINTLYNCRIFTTPIAGPDVLDACLALEEGDSVLNPIVSNTGAPDCFRPG